MKHKTLLIILSILTLVALACGPIGGLIGGGEEDTPPQATQPPAESGGEQPTSPPESSSEQPTSPPESSEEQPTSPPEPSGGAPEIADLDTVNSYRLQMKWRGESEDGSQSYEMTITEAWVKDPPARHFTMSTTSSDTGETPAIAMEMIRIGDSSWMKMGETWMRMDAPDESMMGDDLTNVWEGMLEEEDVENLTPAGEETVNGVHCKHYTTGGDTTVVVPNPEEGGTVEMKVEGEVWIADQPDLPSIAVRWRSRMEGGFFPIPLGGASGESAVVYIEYDVTDINKPITIEPPEE